MREAAVTHAVRTSRSTLSLSLARSIGSVVVTAARALAVLEPELSAFPGTVSVWCGPLAGPPVFARHADDVHYAASTMKVSVLAALHRAAERGDLDLDATVPVQNEFVSAQPGAARFGCDQAYDNDDTVWERIGGEATLRWLAERMIVRSSNLATNLVISHVGLPSVAEVWALAGARHSVTARGIEDSAAREAGIANLVTAADLASLFAAIVLGAESCSAGPPLAAPATCRAILDVLLGQEYGEDLAAGLPAGTRVAQKDGWVSGVRHSAGVVFGDDAPPYVLVVCTTNPSREGLDSDDGAGDKEAAGLISRVAAASWADRAELT
jgi:beta-lactamase class A